MPSGLVGYAGPVYLCKGAGLTDWARAICENDTATLEKLFYENPSLVNDVATGGCTPLHFCGMWTRSQREFRSDMLHHMNLSIL